ncbi:hypothetical protein OQJ18_07715 [Fluoribacter dumoffii]|uniref:Uncharacterized protein n=1 Tax=Fluoribacter dumoffii TaxID=463 RepID=A0A377G923_9GAMM|nr:hypothetical protein [Fluoribacter dumoffii]KTC89765.1 hypothetical protein Ldum_0833 [Fluoribacter dumoffii NY 23]MCW8384960.1 hypothetical protein [Fluoribacter dumoffii]MCW8418021.1 hypothetical protein [Fluoribacter dumoffii]MCW8454137.1 hypothetical protein [Fluoribacter dumoffii]MCW8461789.1 hypothetical protein [Fluoribacter dumoffii]
MLLTLALLVLLSSILVFFSEEFGKAIKKLFAIKGAKLIIPLFAASWLIYSYNFWVLWGIFYLREILHNVLNFLVQILPFQKGAVPLVLIFMLTFISVVPVVILDMLSRRRNFKGYQYPYLTSGIIWILSVALLIIV